MCRVGGEIIRGGTRGTSWWQIEGGGDWFAAAHNNSISLSKDSCSFEPHGVRFGTRFEVNSVSGRAHSAYWGMYSRNQPNKPNTDLTCVLVSGLLSCSIARNFSGSMRLLPLPTMQPQNLTSGLAYSEFFMFKVRPLLFTCCRVFSTWSKWLCQVSE